jgi:hypothetical protein
MKTPIYITLSWWLKVSYHHQHEPRITEPEEAGCRMLPVAGLYSGSKTGFSEF